MRYTDNIRDLRNRRKIRQIFYSRFLFVGLSIFLVFVLNAVFNIYGKYKETKIGKEDAISDLRMLKEREKNLKEGIARLETERGVEEELRKQFGLAKEGEGLIVVLEPEEGADKDLSLEEAGVWASIKNIFKNN